MGHVIEKAPFGDMKFLNPNAQSRKRNPLRENNFLGAVDRPIATP